MKPEQHALIYINHLTSQFWLSSSAGWHGRPDQEARGPSADHSAQEWAQPDFCAHWRKTGFTGGCLRLVQSHRLVDSRCGEHLAQELYALRRKVT